jgi:hypothetical protein
MTSFVLNCTLHLLRYKGSALVPRSVWRLSRLRSVGGAAAVVQVTGINNGTYTLIYHSVMSLLVIVFTFLNGRDVDILVKELAAVDFHRNRFSSYIFKKPYVWQAVSMFTAQLNESVNHGCNWNDSDILSWKICYIARHHLLLQSIATGLRKRNLLANLSYAKLLISHS